MPAAIALFDKNGSVTFTDRQIAFDLKNFQPFQTHAIHIHEFGDLSRGCDSLGGHYNPTDDVHGYHAGDLIFNFTADWRGNFRDKMHQYLDVQDLYGRSVVIHEREDDLGARGTLLMKYPMMPATAAKALCAQLGYKPAKDCVAQLVNGSLSTGNAGGRIACAIIGRK